MPCMSIRLTHGVPANGLPKRGGGPFRQPLRTGGRVGNVMVTTYPPGIRGDLARLFSDRGLHEGKPSMGRALQRVVTRPGPLALALYRLSHALWVRGQETPAELVWRLNFFLTAADIHPGAEIGGGRGVRIGSNVTLLHEVTVGGSARGWFDRVFADGYPEIGDGTEIMAGT